MEKLFESADDVREKYGIKVIAYGNPKDNENKIYQVIEVPSMESMQKVMKDSEITKI